MGLPFAFGCLGPVLLVVVGLTVAAVILRGAVGLANRFTAPVRRDAPIGWDWDADEDNEPLESDELSAAIPEPSLGVGMLVMFLASVVNLAIGFGLRFVLTLDAGRNALDDWPIEVAAHLIGFAAGFIALIGLLAAFLPTTPGRATRVAVLFYLMLLGIVLAIGALFYLVLG